MTPPTGKVVAITGAARGIGRATAVELSRGGALVAIAARASKALPPRVVDWLLRRTGGDEAFVDPDTDARAAYLRRTTD